MTEAVLITGVGVSAWSQYHIRLPGGAPKLHRGDEMGAECVSNTPGARDCGRKRGLRFCVSEEQTLSSLLLAE